MEADRIWDVAIVGAGPVGLATAIALRVRGIENVIVLERAQEFRPVGQTVDLLPNGLKALHCTDPAAYTAVKTAGLAFNQARRAKGEGTTPPPKRFWFQKNLRGEIVRAVPLDFTAWEQRYGEGRISIPWFKLQTQLREQLPTESILCDRCCTDVRQTEDWVELAGVSRSPLPANPFAHWDIPPDTTPTTETSQAWQCRSRIVVGADGINSAVRQALYREFDDPKLRQRATPEYSGFGAIGCLQIEEIPAALMAEFETQYLQDQMVVTLIGEGNNRDRIPNPQTPRIILIRRGERSLGYLMHLPVDCDVLQAGDLAAAIALAGPTLTVAGFPGAFTKLLQLSDPKTAILRPYFLHPATGNESEVLWSRDRVVLVGDAAHGMPPFAAQGANQGLEDAALAGRTLAELVKQGSDCTTISDQFKYYERLRRPFMARVQTATLENHCWTQEQWEQYGDATYGRDLEASYADFTAVT